MAEVGNWLAEGCATVGIGDLELTGANSGYAPFKQVWPAGAQVYYSIENGINREAGVGTFNGNSTISRDTVKATLILNVYNDTDPTPINIDPENDAGCIVRCTMNADAFTDLQGESGLSNHLSDYNNPHRVTSLQATYIDNHNIGETDAQGAIDYALSEIDTGGGGLASHIADKNNPHEVQADQVDYDNTSSGMDAVEVQAGIDELNTDIKNNTELLRYLAIDTTGLQHGGVIAQTGPNTISIAEGDGIIVDAYTDPVIPAGTDVLWADIPTYDLLANGGMPVTTGRALSDVGINNSNSPVSFPGGASPQQRRDYIILGRVIYNDGSITDVYFSPIVTNQAAETTYDLVTFLDANTRTSGLTFRPTDVSMNGGLGEFSSWRESGAFFALGVNYETSKGSPNILNILAAGTDTSPMLFTPFYMVDDTDSTEMSPTTIVSAEYANAGVLANIPSNQFSIQHMFEDIISGERFLMLGQNAYGTYADAVNGIVGDYVGAWKPSWSIGMRLLGHTIMAWSASGATYFDGVQAAVISAGAGSASGSAGGSSANAIDVAYSDSYGIGNNVQVAIDNVAAVRLTTNQKAGMDAANAPSASNAVATVADTSGLQNEIDQNAIDIADNLAAIGVNTGNISTNEGNITNNAAAISINAGNISDNSDDIAALPITYLGINAKAADADKLDNKDSTAFAELALQNDYSKPQSISAYKLFPTATPVSPNLDTHTTFNLTAAGSYSMYAPIMSNANWQEGTRSGYIVISASVTGITWDPAWKFNKGIKPVNNAGYEQIVFFTTRSPSFVMCDVWSET